MLAGKTNIDACSLGLGLIQSRIAEGKDESIDRLSSCAMLALLCAIQICRRIPMASSSTRIAPFGYVLQTLMITGDRQRDEQYKSRFELEKRHLNQV